MHCDGALVGAMLSYMLPKCDDSLTFDNPYIDSIAVSGHKMLGCPMPCGIVITRRANMQTLMRNIEYINSLDTTIVESKRPLSTHSLALACWKGNMWTSSRDYEVRRNRKVPLWPTKIA